MRSKPEIDSDNTIKSLPKEIQVNITKLKASESWPKVTEAGKERMISYWEEDEKEIDNQVGKIPCYSNTNIWGNSSVNIRDSYRENKNGGKDRNIDDDEGDNNVDHNIKSGQTYTVTEATVEADNDDSTKGVFPTPLDGHKSNILEDDKNLNQSFTKSKNQADVETVDTFETIKSHTTKNQSKLLSNSPEINHVVSKAHNNTHNSHKTKNRARKNDNTSRNNPRVHINNNKDKRKIVIKTSNENYIEDSEKLNSNGTYDSERNFDYITTSKHPSTNVAISMKQPNNTILQQTGITLIQTNTNNLTHPTKIKELEKKSLTNKNNKEILPNVPTATEIPNNDRRYSNHPSNKTRKRKIGKKEIKENSRTVSKKSNKTTYTRRTFPDNEILINGVAPKKDRLKKLKYSEGQER